MPRSSADQPDTSNMKLLEGTVTPPVGAPALPAYPPAPNPYLRTPLPADQQLQPDVLRQFYNKGVPQSRIVPLPTTAKASINSSAQGIAKTVVRQIVNQAIGTVSVGLTMPPEFLVSGSPVLGQGTLTVTKATEGANTVFAGTGGTALEELDVLSMASGAASPVSISATPTISGDLPLLFTTQDFNTVLTAFDPGSPWSLAVQTGSDTTIHKQAPSTGTGRVTASGVTGGSWASVLALLTPKTGFSPAVIHAVNRISGAFSSQSNLSIGFTPTAGNTLVVCISSAWTSNIAGPANVTFFVDSQNNVWTQIGTASNAGGSGVQTMVLAASNVAGGATDITFTLDRAIAAASVNALEISNVASLSSLPRFRPLVRPDIPPINLARNQANGGVFGILPVGNGGTGVTTSTGTGSTVLSD